MKLQSALISYSLAISILPMVIIIMLVYLVGNHILVQRSLDELAAVATVQKARLEEVALGHKERLKGVQSRTQLRLSLASYLERPNEEDLERIQRITRDALQSIDDFEAISIIQPNGTILLSEYKDHPLVIHFNPEQSFEFIRDEEGILHLQLTGPFVLDGQTLGYAVAHMKAHHITRVATDYTGLGDSGETLLAQTNENGHASFIAPLRFPNKARWGNIVPHNQIDVPITHALQKEEQVFTNTLDYRGMPVYAATAYLNSLEIGLVVKMDRDEVFAPLYFLILIAGAGLILLLCVISLAAFWLRSAIIQPIETLSKHASDIAAGDLGAELTIQDGNDEISDLTRSFGHMRDELVTTLKTLEKRIANRTRSLKRKTTQLQKTNTFLDSIIEHIPNMIFVKDAQDLRFIRFNKAGEHLIGLSEKEMLGKNDYDFFPKKQADFFTKKDRSVLNAKEIVDIPEEEINTTHGKRLLHTKKIPLLDTDGNPEYLLGISEDITEHKELMDVKKAKKRIQEESEQRKKFQLAVESSTDAVLIVDAQNHVVYANPSWQKLTGFSLNEMKKQHEARFIDEEQSNPKAFQAMKKALKEGKTFKSEHLVHTRKNGRHYPVELTIYPIKEHGRVRFYVRIHHDISKRKRVDTAKSEFVSLASHQLRTPLTALRWMFNLFTSKQVDNLTKNQRDMMQDGYNAVQSMSETIGTMLTLSRIESGKLSVNHSTFDLTALIQELISEYTPIYSQKELRVSLRRKKQLRIRSDKKLLREALANLISNAIKYTPHQGKVDIRITQHKRSVRIDISDTGFGIPDHQQAKIFTRFFRGENILNREPDGTGLGLYLVRSLATLLKGKISFTSTENEGTTFSLRLPC